MDKNELTKRLMATYLEELHEHVDSMNRDLLALEKNPTGEERAELLKVLFRAAHSVKGASHAVNIDLLASACHAMEDLFAQMRDDGRTATPAVFSLLFKTVDGMEEAGMRLRDDHQLEDSTLESLVPMLQKAANGEEIAEDLAVVLADAPSAVESADQQDVENSGDTATASNKDQGKPAAGSSQDSPAASTPKAASPKPATRQPPAAMPTTTAKGTAAAHATIRVAAEKLDGLLAQSGELLVARRRVEFRSSDAAALRDSLSRIRQEWNDLEKPLTKLLGDVDRPESADLVSIKRLPRRAAGVLARMSSVLKQLERDADGLHSNMLTDGRLLGQTCDALNDEVHDVRMLPFAEATSGLQRVVRDLAGSTGKKIKLEIRGDDVEVDRSVLEGLKDPLTHLVRNAIDHGIESPADRLEKVKPAEGQITISAELRGGNVEVVVQDDGRGFDMDRIRDKVNAKGWKVPDDDRELARLVFAPGFSTAPIVTDVSGRGVGLDVVQTQIESLHGSVDVSFEPNGGSRFTMTVPLTLTTIRCLLAVVHEQTFAIPTSTVQQIVRFGTENVRSVGGRDMLLLGDRPIPLAGLSDTLGQKQSVPMSRDSKLLAVVLHAGDQAVAFLVDELKTEQEMLVKNLGARIRRLRHFSGATLLPTGRVALVLNVANLVRSSLGIASIRTVIAKERMAVEKTQPRLLVVDDSVTTRTLMKSILETANYIVTAAVDGQHAWELLQDESFDLVVSDVDMPRMTGFELAAAIRGKANINEIPVVLVTARGTEEDKERGIRVGANAYLVKSGFDQSKLLEAVEQLV